MRVSIHLSYINENEATHGTSRLRLAILQAVLSHEIPRRFLPLCSFTNNNNNAVVRICILILDALQSVAKVIV